MNDQSKSIQSIFYLPTQTVTVSISGNKRISSCYVRRTGSALALLYGTQNTMEHHHFNHAVMIINSEVRYEKIFFSIKCTY